MSEDYKAELERIAIEINSIDRSIERLSKKRQQLNARKASINSQIIEKASEELANQDWGRCDHPWSDKVKEILKSKFKMDKFRPHQLSTINAIMSGHDCILLMPTGGGKSLCYQLPAMVLDGITLVVSPLVSLMEDQIMAMEALNLPATLLQSSSTREHVNNVHKEMTTKNPSFKLLYVTPEKLAKSKRFMSKLEKMYQMGLFSLLAIDEVHCCSQWGHDFRKDYKFLGIMKRQFPKVPILGLTATATTSLIQDVQNILNIQGCLVLKASFNRPNLKYEVVCKSSCQKDNVSELEDLLNNRFNGLSGIIYCFSIKDCEEIASDLRKRGIKAKAYHAQMDAERRSSVHKSWTSNGIQVIVATVAFGMGIDKPDVRFVIHHSLPKSMENFYQESGRAGRDDHPASCILFYRFGDVFRQSTMVFTEQKGLDNLYSMVAYCLDLSRCRRALIAQHFGERWEVLDCNKMCDHCEQIGLYEEKVKNTAREYKSIFNILEHASMLKERLTSQKLIETWQGKGPSKLRPPGHLSTTLNRENCERIIALLLLESYLKEEFHFTPYSTISYINIGDRILPGGQDLPFPMSVVKIKNEENSSIKPESTAICSLDSQTSSPKVKATPSKQSSTSTKKSSSSSLSSVAKEMKPNKNSIDTDSDSVKHKGKFDRLKQASTVNKKTTLLKKRPISDVSSQENSADIKEIKKVKRSTNDLDNEVIISDDSDNDVKVFDFNTIINPSTSAKKLEVPTLVLSDSN
ncbi:ATP-dependent DNA helicase Q1 [Caerostris darwini]|uniref:ATP-dependent DNA helicase n=1 Tax=Caerostris darwini TaxID=1538125 RepID=A0AAV4SAK2_9ARAC|nr:ATP-dependent DNA helicase Q1 [Caerostris darwini]